MQVNNAAIFSDPTLRPQLEQHYENKKASVIESLKAREAEPDYQANFEGKIRMPDGTYKELTGTRLFTSDTAEKAFVNFDTWLDMQEKFHAMSEKRLEIAQKTLDFLEKEKFDPIDKNTLAEARANLEDAKAWHDQRQDYLHEMNAFLLNVQESAGIGKPYDFSDMSRQEIADAGKALFEAGMITLDELFRFEHPDGKLRMGPHGNAIAFDPDERIDFIAEIRKAIDDMVQSGEAERAAPRYKMMLALLEKLAGFQAKANTAL